MSLTPPLHFRDRSHLCVVYFIPPPGTGLCPNLCFPPSSGAQFSDTPSGYPSTVFGFPYAPPSFLPPALFDKGSTLSSSASSERQLFCTSMPPSNCSYLPRCPTSPGYALPLPFPYSRRTVEDKPPDETRREMGTDTPFDDFPP